MRMVGLYEFPYWLSTWEGIITFIASVLCGLFGMMLQFDFFLKNNFVDVFMFFIFQLNMVIFFSYYAKLIINLICS